MRRLSLRKSLPRHWPLILPVAIGIAFVAVAAKTAAPTITFAIHAIRTEGTFIGALTRTTANGGGSSYHPMFRYQTNDGSIRSFTVRAESTKQLYRDGEKVALLYDPENPEDVRLDSFSGLWLSPLAIGLPGLLLIGMGLLLLTGARRKDG